MRFFIGLAFIVLILSSCVSGDVAGVGVAGSSDPSGVAQVSEPTVTPIPTVAAASRPTYIVEMGTVAQTLSFTGRWLPRDQMNLSFEMPGTVRAVNVRRGDTINIGDLLADFQISDLENQLASARLQLDNARRRLESGGTSSEDSVMDAKFNLADAQLSLENAEVSLPWTSVNSAWLNVENAQRELEDAQRAYNDLLGQATSSATAVDQARSRVLSAESGLDNAWLNYYQAAQNYHSSTIQVDKAENNVLRSTLSLEDAQSGGDNPDLIQSVNEAQLNVDQTLQKIEQSSLYSPLAGVVLEVVIKPGDQVQAFNTVITVAIPEPLEVNANLAFNDTQKLSVGMIGVCNIVNQPDTAVQCVIRQVPLSNRDADQTVRVAASFTEVTQGQLIEVEMPLDVRENVLWLPPEAIRTFQNRTYVVLQTEDGQRVVDIQIGLKTDERVEIVSGLNLGDKVVGE